MKLNLHPKEFLALYNLLHTVPLDNPDQVNLSEVRNRMKSYAISALAKKELDPPDDVLLKVWENNQKEKINNLEKMNDDIKKNMFILDKDEKKSDDPPQPVVTKIGKVKVSKLFRGRLVSTLHKIKG